VLDDFFDFWTTGAKVEAMMVVGAASTTLTVVEVSVAIVVEDMTGAGAVVVLEETSCTVVSGASAVIGGAMGLMASGISAEAGVERITSAASASATINLPNFCGFTCMSTPLGKR
jgi:hypothetical protein